MNELQRGIKQIAADISEISFKMLKNQSISFRDI